MTRVLFFLTASMLTYFVLSLEYKNQPFFEHFYKLTAPITKTVQEKSVILFNAAYDQGSVWGEKLFKNAKPEIKTPSSPQEKISNEERADLDQLIKEYDSH